METNIERLKKVSAEHGGSNSVPSVYVGTYKKYNNGDLFGCWIDITSFDSYEDFIATCKYLHADEKDPEIMLQDYTCFPRSFYCESGLDKETYEAILEYYALSDDEKDAYEVYCEYECEPSVEKFKQRYLGEYNDLEEYAIDNDDISASFIGVDYDVFQQISGYIDYSRIAREMDIDGFFCKEGYAFSSSNY